METSTELVEGLRDIPGTRMPPADLAAAVNMSFEENAEVVTLGDLASFSDRRSAQQPPWGVSTGCSAPHMGAFVVLRARLSVSPDTAACVGGRSAAEVRGWLRRPTSAAIGYPEHQRVPWCLMDYAVNRWSPRIPTDVLHGLPVWKPETLLAYMGIRPGRFPWTDIAEWLPEACSDVDPDLVAVELQDRPAAAWARTAYLLHRGAQPDIAAALKCQGPQLDSGPHYFGRPVAGLDDAMPWLPVWSSEYGVVDYALERNWSYDWDT